MGRSLIVAIVVGLAVGVSCVATAEADASAKYPCKAKHSKLLKKRGFVRVFRLRRDARDPQGEWWTQNDVVICDGRVGRWFAPYPAEFESVGLVRISGEFVGFDLSHSCGACFGDTSTVGVTNAATGKVVFERSRDNEDGQGEFDITDMVLEPNGSVAFIAVGNWRSSRTETRTVVRHDCYGTRILQESKRIRSRSLKLEGGMLRWRSGRKLRTAGIC
ncbi:MAG: hypothetical protein ACRDKE_11650 [Solirubrobacterales bacterium]